MRERLTVWFVLIAVGILAGVLLLRSHSLASELREHQRADLAHAVQLEQAVLAERLADGRPVDGAFLAGLTAPRHQLVWSVPGESDVRATGAAYTATPSSGAPVSVQVSVGGGTLTLSESGEAVDDLVHLDRQALLGQLLLAGVIAGAIGWLVARQLASPFRQLAVAAELLGRGRFDLDLPRHRMPEVRAISQALMGSAGRLQERLSREQEFAEHASHVLRTPLTGLRLELEELSLRDDLPTDARETVRRSLDRIDSMDVVAGELVQLSRGGSLVAGSEVSLQDLATLCAQRWADTLAEHDRPLTASVEGDLATTYTPGPVEHILDLLLVDVLRRGVGPVRLVFTCDADANLRISVSCAGDLRPTRGPGEEVPITQAHAVSAALGGRLTGDHPAEGIEVLVPRR